MASNKKEVTLNRSFAYTDKEGKEHYFTRSNAHTIPDVLSSEHLDAYAKSGTISVSDAVEPANSAGPAAVAGTAAPARK